LDVDDLIVAEAYVGKNMILKRFHARGRGKASSVMRPFSQLTVVVRQVEQEAKAEKKKSKPAAKSKSAKPAVAKEAV